MEIQKIFSNTENEEENLYSVLMTEDEVVLFSEFQKEFNSKAQKALRRKFDTEVGKSFNPKSNSGVALRFGRKTLRGENYHSGVHRDVTGKIVGNGADKYYGNGINDLISRRGRGSRLTTNKTAVGRKSESQFYRATKMKPESLKAHEMHNKAAENLVKHYKQLYPSKSVENLKKAGKIAAATVGTAGLIYGAKKLHDKKKKEEEN